MTKFDEIDEARRLLELEETASLSEIRSAYRRLAHQHHPDKHNEITGVNNIENDRLIKKLNSAYKLLMDYCNDYRYSFRKEDISRADPFDEELSNWKDKWSF
ncbi:MAG: J domain-containing protein [Dehalococcoidales bacterium]|nr:J domain-containing protein [Dehalococcoidales bacterium]